MGVRVGWFGFSDGEVQNPFGLFYTSDWVRVFKVRVISNITELPISPIFDRSSCLNGVVFAGGQIPCEPIFDFIRRREVRLQNHEKSGGNQFRFAFDIVMGEHDCSFLD
ncbi:hypothetical protein YC2023_081648 [Brassica napus]